MSTDKPHHRISRTIQAAHKEDRRAGRTRVTGCTSPQRGHCVAFKSKCLTETQWKSIPYWNTFRFGPCWRPALAGSAIAPRVPMPHARRCFRSGLPARALALRPDCHACGRALALCTCNACTCKTSLGTDSAFCYRPYAAPCFFLSWYPWILCQVSVYVVGRVWHQPNFALPWLGSARATARCMRAGIVHERCNLCGVDDTYGGYAGCLLYAQHEIGTIVATNNEDEVSKALGPVAWARPDLRYVTYVL